MSASLDDDPLSNDRRVSLHAKLDEAIDRIEKLSNWENVDVDATASVVRRLEDLIDADFGPRYNESGYISPIQSCTAAELRLWFGTNTHRRSLLLRVENWLRLAKAVGAKRLLIDGSFVTGKSQPGDVDCAILLPDDFKMQLLARKPEAIELLIGMFTREPKELLYAEVEEDWWGWVEFFGRTRESTGQRKGLIEVRL